MKIINLTCVSATFELLNNDVYYSNNSFDVFLNDAKIYKDINTNVFTIYNLLPNTSYIVKVNNKEISFVTKNASNVVDIYPDNKEDSTKEIQNIIDLASDNSLININEGTYNITSLFLKDNITINLKKGAILKANTNPDEYKEFTDSFILKNGETAVLGTYEGLPHNRLKTSIINGIEVANVDLVGQGVIDGQAQLSSWWINYKEKPYARPHLLFLNRCSNMNVVGLKFMNSPQWTIHPFFSKNIHFYNLDIENPKISPNTDGLNPQCCNEIDIIGVHFSVGDDCIAIKSGKMDLANIYKTPCENITIRNCLMQYGHGGIVLGSENSGGIKNLTCERCFFDHTDRGLRIKTRRGRGKLAIIDNVVFNNIVMDHVLSPLVINMFYYCDPDGKTEYVWTKEKLPIDDRTPYMGKFTFNNIKATNCEYCVGYFYGLPELPIQQININNSSFSFLKNAKEGEPAMMSFAEKCHKRGLIYYNVKEININNLEVVGYEGELHEVHNNEIFNK